MAQATAAKTRGTAPRTLGFGVPATSDPHHFKVLIPKSSTGKVQISEYLGMQAATTECAVIDRVLLERPRWMAIRAEVQRAFNARLAAHGLKPSAWKVGENPVDRLLGRELCVLAWAVERLNMEKIPIAVRNWLALRPEERWWLFTMTNAATGHAITGRGKGWRKAVRFALTENPVAVGHAIADSPLYRPRERFGLFEALEPRPTLEADLICGDHKDDSPTA